MDMIYRGWRYLDRARRRRACGAGNLPVPRVAGYDVDLGPLLKNEVLMNP